MEIPAINTKEKILQFIRIRGPVLPVHVAKTINTNILMASAHLSELVSKNVVKLSRLKIGGSPLYYLPGQENRLEQFVDNLNDKERKVFELMKERKVLRDFDLDPVFRVAIRHIEDFAIPLEVTHKDNKEIFWKLYSLSNSDVESLIRAIIKPKETIEKEVKKEPKEEKITKETTQKEDKQIAKKEELKKDEQLKPYEIIEDLFYKKINSYFNKNRIEVIQKEIIKKNSEIDLIIKVPSAIGDIAFYCKAKTKKKLTDTDIMAAFIKGQNKKLPVLLLSDGELTKKASIAIEKDYKLQFKQI